MKIPVERSIISCLVVLLVSSCSRAIFFAYGMHPVKDLSDKNIIREAHLQNIPEWQVYRLDTSFLKSRLTDSIQVSLFKNYYQPMQVMVFNKEGNMISRMVNCYAGGFPNLNWNRNGQFDVFPPASVVPTDSLISLTELVKNFKTYQLPVSPAVLNPEYTVVVFWNRFGGRQSRNLIREVQKSLRKGSPETIRLYYVNNDSWLHSE